MMRLIGKGYGAALDKQVQTWGITLCWILLGVCLIKVIVRSL